MSSSLPPGWSIPPSEQWIPRAATSILAAGEGNRHDVVPLVWLVAAHGGAGVSTLCQWWDFVGDADGRWPEKDTYPTVVVVAKTTMESLGACDTQVRSVVAGATTCVFLGVVVVDPQPRLPRRVEHRLTSLAATVEYAGGRLWRIPYYAGLVEVLVAELPTWSLGGPEEVAARHSRRRFREDVTQVVPEAVRQVGREIAEAALGCLRAGKETSVLVHEERTSW